MQTRLKSISILIGILILGLATASQASKCQYPFATEIIRSTPHVDKTPEDILGAPDGIAADFDNQGRTPSTVVVGFSSNIINRKGNDFSITYWDLTENQERESSEVLVKGPGYNFTRIGTIVPTPGLRERRVSQTAFFNLDVLGWNTVDQVMVRNFRANQSSRQEGLDIDGFTAIHCDDAPPPRDDHIAIHVSGLRDTKATCWNTTNNDLVPARKDDEGKHSCSHLYTERGDSVLLTVDGESKIRQ